MPYGYHSPETDTGRFSLSYILMPPRYRKMDIVIRSLSYITLIWLGLASFFLIPVVKYSSLPVALFGLIALYGSARRSLRIEYGVVWFLASSVFIQAIIMWFTHCEDVSLKYMLALSWTSLFVFVAQRANRLGATSKLLYELRVQELEALANNGE